MQGKVVEVATGRKVLLFDEEDLQDTIKVSREHKSGGSQGRGVMTRMVLVRVMPLA